MAKGTLNFQHLHSQIYFQVFPINKWHCYLRFRARCNYFMALAKNLNIMLDSLLVLNTCRLIPRWILLSYYLSPSSLTQVSVTDF